MASELEKVDPQWAWEPFVPDRRQPWNRTLAAHLFRRAGFGGNWREIDNAAADDPQAVVERLFANAAADRDRFDREMEVLASHLLAADNVDTLPAWWLYRMIHTPAPLVEKATLFWHGHFATSAAKVREVRLMLDQNRLLRRHALGPFSELLHGVARDPAMLLYLDSATNRKTHPNENFAREVMELFCLGLGNYTEHDIQELSRCFTGWEIRRGKFHFDRFQHDYGTKTVLGESGEFDGDEALRVLLRQPAAARFLVGKLVRFYVTDHQPLPEALMEPLAEQLRRDDYTIGPTLRRIVGSRLFFSTHAIGAKIRSPIEFAIGLMRSLGASTNTNRMAEGATEAGQTPFFPPNVKGWDGGPAWINSSTLIARANLAAMLMRSEQTRYAAGNLEQLAANCGAQSPPEIVAWLLELLVAVPVPPAVHERLEEVLRATGERSRRMADVVVAIATLPEFQLA